MAKLCLKVGGVTKELDLDGGNGSVVRAGDAPFVIKDAYERHQHFNNTDTLRLVMAYFRESSYELQVWARISTAVSSNENPTIDIPVYNPGTDDREKYPAGFMTTFFLLKGEQLSFISNRYTGYPQITDGTYPYSPAYVVTRVIIP